MKEPTKLQTSEAGGSAEHFTWNQKKKTTTLRAQLHSKPLRNLSVA